MGRSIYRHQFLCKANSANIYITLGCLKQWWSMTTRTPTTLALSAGIYLPPPPQLAGCLPPICTTTPPPHYQIPPLGGGVYKDTPPIKKFCIKAWLSVATGKLFLVFPKQKHTETQVSGTITEFFLNQCPPNSGSKFNLYHRNLKGSAGLAL